MLSVGIWSLWAGGYATRAAAAAVTMVAVMGLLVFVTLVVAGQRIGKQQLVVEGEAA